MRTLVGPREIARFELIDADRFENVDVVQNENNHALSTAEFSDGT